MTDARAALVGAGYDAMGEAFAAWRDRIVGDPRHWWAEQLASRLVDGADVLELGCGSGVPVTRRLAERYRVTGVDISPKQVERARAAVPGAEFVVGDFTALEFTAASFDAVASFYVFNHVPRDLLAPTFARIRRWLRPGGYLLTALGVTDNPGWYGVFVGGASYFSSFPPEVNRLLLHDGGFDLLLDEIVTFTEPEGEARFQWVLAQR